MKQLNYEKSDLIILIFSPIIATLLSLALHANFLTTMILYLAIPSIYFSYKTPLAIKKTMLIALWALPITLFLDYIAFLNETWAVPTIFPFRILSLIPLEDFIFSFLFVYFVVILKEHFFEKSHNPNYYRLVRYGITVIIFLILFFILYFYSPDTLRIPYYYLWLVIVVFLLPIIITSIIFPKLRRIMILIGGYFFLVMLPYELVALYLGLWSFPSTTYAGFIIPGINYIGLIKIFGFQFPIEEFLTWEILAAAAVVCYAEFGIEMGKKKNRWKNNSNVSFSYKG